MPKWFPFPPAVYAPRAQKMDLHQLFHVMDVIFNEVRGNLHSIQTLHGMLDRVYKTGSCSIGTRAGIDSFFEFLEDEALAKMGGAKGPGAPVKEEAQDDDVIARADDVIPAATTVASETSGVGAEEEPGRVRKRPRDENAPKVLPGALPTASPTNSTANSLQVNAAPLAEDEIDFEKHMSEEGGQYFAEFDALTQPQPFWDPALIPGGVDALAPDLSVAFEPHVQIDESAAQPAPWDFHSSGEFSHSGQSTLATGSDPMLHSDSAFQAGSGGNIPGGNGYNSTPTSSRNWTPDWYEDISPQLGGVYQMPAQHAPGQQVPGQQPPQNENLVRARLREQMELSERGLDTWTTAGVRNDTIPNPPLASEAAPGPPRLNKDDGLSESMRWDFLPQQQGAFTTRAAPGGQYGENAQFGRAGPVQPVMRAVGLAMARAPSFSPVQSFADRAPPQAAPAPQNPKPSGFLQKAKVLISPRSSGSPRASAPPKPMKARAAKAEAFPLARGALSVAPAQPLPGQKALPEERKNGEPEHLARWGPGDQNEGSLSGRQQSGGGLSSRQDSGGGSLSGWSDSGGQDQESRSGELSEKAHKILGIEAGRDPCVVGDLLERSGSLEEGDAGAGKKGLARFLPKLGRNKGKASERNASNKDVDDGGLRPALYSDGSGEGLTPRVSGEGFDSRQGVASGLAIGGGFAPPPRGGGDLYAPLGAHPPEDCEAFPLARDVPRFDSFKSENSLTAVESESEELESFPVERRMQQLSVSEGEGAVHTGPGSGQPAGGNAPPPRPEQAYGREGVAAVKAPSPIGVGSAGVQRESGLTPKSILNEGRLNGVPAQVNGGVPEGGPVEEDEDEERPGSPGFALGLGQSQGLFLSDDLCRLAFICASVCERFWSLRERLAMSQGHVS